MNPFFPSFLSFFPSNSIEFHRFHCKRLPLELDSIFSRCVSSIVFLPVTQLYSSENIILLRNFLYSFLETRLVPLALFNILIQFFLLSGYFILLKMWLKFEKVLGKFDNIVVNYMFRSISNTVISLKKNSDSFWFCAHNICSILWKKIQRSVTTDTNKIISFTPSCNRYTVIQYLYLNKLLLLFLVYYYKLLIASFTP